MKEQFVDERSSDRDQHVASTTTVFNLLVLLPQCQTDT